MKSLLKQTAMMAMLGLALSGCSDKDDDDGNGGDNGPAVIYGAYVNVGNGKARSFIVKKADGTPQEVGFDFTEEALSGLPAHNTSFLLPMPAENRTLINHISFDYTPHGHEPDHVYTVPHFDVHFYMISQEERNLISVTDPKIEILPPAEYIPRHYVPGPAESKMGKHWADTTSAEFHGKPFTQTLIYGSYNGKFIFIEPMIAVDYLKTKPNVRVDVPRQAKVQENGLYPQKYAIEWEKDRKLYTITLGELELRRKDQ